MDQSRIWDHYQGSDEASSAFDASGGRYRFIARRIRADDTVLNIGIGRGGLERLLKSRDIEVFSLDPGEAGLRRMHGELGAGGCVGLAEALPFADRSFDVVVMTEVIEHLNEQTTLKALAEVKRVLRPRGVFIGSVPAEEVLSDSECVCPSCGTVFHRWGHVQRFSRATLTALLNACFTSVRVQRRYFYDPAALNWVGWIVALLKSAAVRARSSGRNETFFFMARA
jgi:ubiquinone/menaquinone biosynthesis C-methylase UbiE